MNYVDRIYYINLDRRQDRNHQVMEQLKLTGLLNITERVQAVDGSKITLNSSNNLFTSYGINSINGKYSLYGITLTKGGAGCALSHRNVWLKINNTPNVNRALILEDDVSIINKKIFSQKLNELVKNAPKNFDVLFVGYHPGTLKYMNKSFDQFTKSKKTYGLFGYIVTKKGAEKLLKIYPIDYQIDTEISRKIHDIGLEVYLVKPEHRIIHSEPSEISKSGTDIQLNKKEIKEGFPTENVMNDMWNLIVFFCIALLITLVIRTCSDPKSVEP